MDTCLQTNGSAMPETYTLAIKNSQTEFCGRCFGGWSEFGSGRAPVALHFVGCEFRNCVLAFGLRYLFADHQCAYESECKDQPAQEGHWVDCHCFRQVGHTPPLSNVFQASPHVQDQSSSLAGDQPQSGQRM